MKENIFQYPLKHSRIVWRHKAPNITTLLTNTILPKERNYSPSHLCYNVYAERVIDNEIESSIKGCTGVDIGVDSGPILFQRFGVEENGLEVLSLEKFKDSENYYFKRIMLLPNVLQNSIKDIKLQTSADFLYDKSNGINIFLRSSNEVSVINLKENNKVLEYKVLLKAKVSELIKRLRDIEGVESQLKEKSNSDLTVYSIISSLYDFLEFTILLSNKLILKISLRFGFEKKLELDLNKLYPFENEVVQCISYGSNPNSYLLGGKGLYILKKDVNNNYQVRMLFPCRDTTMKDFDDNEFEENTLRNLVSFNDRLMKLQVLRKKNISYSNITAISVHPVYSNIIALIDSRSSKVVIIDLFQNSRIPLGEFSIPFTESLGNHTSRFRYIEWVYPEIIQLKQGKNKCQCGLILYCSSYYKVIYSLIVIEYDDKNSDQYYRMTVKGVKELYMGIWDLEQNRNYYIPKRTQLLESNVDLLDMILENYSIDDNLLSQIFHGLSGLTVFLLKKVGMGYLVISPCTSRHNILIEEDQFNESLIFLSLSTCGRLSCKNVYIIKEGDSLEDEKVLDLNMERIDGLIYDQIYGKELDRICLNKQMKESLGEFYQFILRKENEMFDGLIKIRILEIPQIMEPRVEDRMGNLELRVVNKTSQEDLFGENNDVVEDKTRELRRKGTSFKSESLQDDYQGLNEELEVGNEQLTRRQYYNSSVYNGRELIDWLLESGEEWKFDDDNKFEKLGEGVNIELMNDFATPVLSEMDLNINSETMTLNSQVSDTPELIVIEEEEDGVRRKEMRDGVYFEDGNWRKEDIMNSTRLELPLPLTNGFDYRKEFKNVPGVLWSEDSVVFKGLKGECIHIPSLETQPFPLCSCRYFEENLSNTEENNMVDVIEGYDGNMGRSGVKSKPVFDIIGAKDYEYNSTLEEYLSFVIQSSESDFDGEDEDGDEEDIREDGDIREDDKGEGVYILKDTLKLLSDGINRLPLTPVSESIAENYLKYNKYLGGKLNDKKLLKSKWKISQSCSRMRQPGCLLKYLIINDFEVKRAFNQERILREKEDKDDNMTHLDEDEEELERRLEVEMEEIGEEEEEEGEGNGGDNGNNDKSERDKVDVENEQGSEGEENEDDDWDGYDDDDDGDEEEDDDEEEEEDGEKKRSILPNRGLYINKKLLSTLKLFWDESCDYYGLNKERYEEEEYFQVEKKETINLLKDDLSQWYNYPYISFESVDAKIEGKEQLRLSLMSYVDTQLSNM